jgi:hypothetical protein
MNVDVGRGRKKKTEARHENSMQPMAMESSNEQRER